MKSNYEEDLKAIYSVIVYWWGFCKDTYPKSLNDDEVSKWIDECEKKQKEMQKDDKGLAWLYRRMGIIIMDFCLKKQQERKGKKVEW